MQDQYVGDIGDYGKYGLLRFLFTRQRPLRLGIVWCHTPNEIHKNDGKYTGYLSQEAFRECDPELYDRLKGIVNSGKRTCRQIQASGLFPANTLFCSSPLSGTKEGERNKSTFQVRLDFRNQWLAHALKETEPCEAVFLDPDNGLEVPSVPKSSPRTGKYVYLDEVASFVRREQITVVYHHLCRQGSHEGQVRNRCHQLRKILPPKGKVSALRFRAFSARTYFLLTLERQHAEIQRRLESFLSSPWSRYFQWLNPSITSKAW